MKTVGFQCRRYSYLVPRSVAVMIPMNSEGDTILRDLTGLWLTVDGPCAVKLVLVDDDRSGCRDYA